MAICVFLPMMETIFFELFESLPRQGPGNRQSASNALKMCSELVVEPRILDLGCGTGAQTFYLTELTGGTVVAIDSYAPFLEQLQAEAIQRGLQTRVEAVIADIGDFADASKRFDLIWSEGALYNVGIEAALDSYIPVLNESGYFVFTDAVWRKDNPPQMVAAMFADYPAMGKVQNIVDIIEAKQLKLNGHFPLPAEAWLDEFYVPMEEQLEKLRHKYEANPMAQTILDELATEPALYRQYSDYYGYEFFVVSK